MARKRMRLVPAKGLSSGHGSKADEEEPTGKRARNCDNIQGGVRHTSGARSSQRQTSPQRQNDLSDEEDYCDARASLSDASVTSSGAENDDTVETSDNEDTDGESIGSEELQVDFDFCNPVPGDFHLVKAFVQRFLDGADLDSSQLADCIIEQAEVSTAVRVGGDCVGISAILPFQHCAPQCHGLKQIAEYWRRKAPRNITSQLDAALSSDATGLFLSERVHNAPLPLAPPLMAGLLQELVACASSDDPGVQPHGAVTQLLVCARAYIDDGDVMVKAGAVPVARAGTSGKKSKKAARMVPTMPHSQATTHKVSGADAPAAAADTALVFLRPEDEAMRQHAQWEGSWAAPQEGEFRRQARCVRVLMLVPITRAQSALRELAAKYGHDLAQHGL